MCAPPWALPPYRWAKPRLVSSSAQCFQAVGAASAGRLSGTNICRCCRKVLATWLSPIGGNPPTYLHAPQCPDAACRTAQTSCSCRRRRASASSEQTHCRRCRSPASAYPTYASLIPPFSPCAPRLHRGAICPPRGHSLFPPIPRSSA